MPADNFSSNLVRLPDGQVWFATSRPGMAPGLGVATRSGIVVPQDLPSPYVSGNSYGSGGGMAAGPDGNLWLTTANSSIVRISGLDSVSGGLDYRHRSKQAPDYSYDEWTNVSGTEKPTFACVATPGAEVTLWAQQQGDNQPVSIGQVKASRSDGSWTLKSHLKLSDGNRAVTATQTGNTGPPSVLSSLEPDSSGNLSSALVIQTSRASNARPGR